MLQYKVNDKIKLENKFKKRYKFVEMFILFKRK